MALVFVILLFALSTGAKWLMEELHIGEAWDAGDKEFYRTALGNEAHSLLKRVSRFSAVLSIWTILDMLWLPWLKIEDVAMGWGDWKHVSAAARAAVVVGWFVALSAFLLSFSLGI